MSSESRRSSADSASSWRSVAALDLGAIVVYVAAEWLFFATKPSFLDSLPAVERVLVACRVAVWPLAATGLALGLLFASHRAWPRARRALLASARLPAVLFGAATLLLLVDNFAYTVLGWGTPSLEGWARALGPAAFSSFCLLLWQRSAAWQEHLSVRRAFRLGLLAIAAGVAAAGALHGFGLEPESSAGRTAARAGALPNIVMFGGDGIDADRTSLYGAERRTTPTLERLARQSIVAENFFSNVSATGGSIVSMFTSALPTETGVLFAPDIAEGEWVHQHLPGLLREHGYSTFQLTMRWYADVLDLNLQSSFDWANGRAPAEETAHTLTRALDPNAGYFARLLVDRLAERLVPHRVGSEARDAHREITLGEAPKSSDEMRLRAFASIVERAPEPFFAHVHLLGSHGPRFRAPQRFSLGRTQDRDFDLDFYDDAIAQFDERVRTALDHLARRGRLDRTIFVVYADHGMQWATLERLPLVIRTPGGATVARIAAPVQGLDVAPTLLELAGLPQPGWMRGRSLLAPERAACPEILSFRHTAQRNPAKGNKHFARAEPPFFGLAGISRIVGSEAITLGLPSGEVRRVPVGLGGGAGERCPRLDVDTSVARLVRHLAEHGFDVSKLAPRLASP